MTVTYFSFLSAIVCSTILMAALVLLKERFFDHNMYRAYKVCCVYAVFRMLLVFELPMNATFLSKQVESGLSTIENAIPVLEYFEKSSVLSTIIIVMTVIWLSIALYRIARVSLGYWKNYIIAYNRYASCDNPMILGELERAKQEMKITRQIRVVQIEGLKEPKVTGFFQSTIFIPLDHLSSHEAHAIFRHELAHLKSGDIWVMGLLTFIRELFFWIPMTGRLMNRLEEAFEFRCDQRASFDQNPVFKYYYAATLQKVGKSAQEALVAREFTFEGNNIIHFIFGMSQANLPPVRKGDLVSERIHKFFNEEKVPVKRMSFVASLILLAMFCAASLAFILPMFEHFGYDLPTFQEIEMSPNNSYLIDNGDGTYGLYINGMCFKNDISDVTNYISLPIVEK